MELQTVRQSAFSNEEKARKSDLIVDSRLQRQPLPSPTTIK